MPVRSSHTARLTARYSPAATARSSDTRSVPNLATVWWPLLALADRDLARARSADQEGGAQALGCGADTTRGGPASPPTDDLGRLLAPSAASPTGCIGVSLFQDRDWHVEACRLGW